MDTSISEFIERLASKEPTPGGGGASALIGAVGVSLCSMVANLTSGKQKYAVYQAEIEQILVKTKVLTERLLALMDEDATAFEPLSKAYGIPKDNPERDTILENALVNASKVPFDILNEISGAADILEELAAKGSRLAVSDVGVAAAACRSAMEGAALNVYINTKLMKNKTYADSLNTKTATILNSGVKKCGAVYEKVLAELGR